MSVTYLAQRPNVLAAIQWDGTNLQEVVLSFPQDYQQYFTVEDGTNDLVYADSQHFAVGTYMLYFGGVSSIVPDQMNQYQIVETDKVDYVFSGDVPSTEA